MLHKLEVLRPILNDIFMCQQQIEFFFLKFPAEETLIQFFCGT